MTDLSISSACGLAMMDSTGFGAYVAQSPMIRVYGGAVPDNVDAALGSAVVLAELACATNPFTGYTDIGSAIRATFDAIAEDSDANDTATATFWRLEKNGGTAVMQGDVGDADDDNDPDLTLNTTAITAGSTVAITSATIDLPKYAAA